MSVKVGDHVIAIVTKLEQDRAIIKVLVEELENFKCFIPIEEMTDNYRDCIASDFVSIGETLSIKVTCLDWVERELCGSIKHKNSEKKVERSKSNGLWMCESFSSSEQITEFLNKNKDIISNVTIMKPYSYVYEVFFYTENGNELK